MNTNEFLRGDLIAIAGKGEEMSLIDANDGSILNTFTKQEPTEIFTHIQWNQTGDKLAVFNKDVNQTHDTLEMWDANAMARIWTV